MRQPVAHSRGLTAATVGDRHVRHEMGAIALAVPSVYWWVGVTPAGTDAAAAPDNHSDAFFVDEAGMQVGLRSLLHVAVDYLQGGAAR